MRRRRAAVIFNPMSGRPGRRRGRVATFTTALQSYGIDAVAREPRGVGDATRLTRDALDDGAEVVVSYGGDGTVNEVLQAMIGRDAHLAVWPGGTANLLAVDVGMPRDPLAVAAVIASGKTCRINVGRARLSGEATERYFVMCAGVGLDASICRATNPKLKRWTGQFAFWVAGVRRMIVGRPESFTIEIDGARYRTIFAVVANGPRYGGGFVLTPRASLAAPTLEVFVAHERSHGLAYVPDVVRCLRGRTETASQVVVSAATVRATSTGRPWVELDGELVGQLPATFDLVPDALSVIVP